MSHVDDEVWTGPARATPVRSAAGVPGPAGRPHGGTPIGRPVAIRPPASLVGVVLCEDHEVFRLGLRVVLEAQPDMAVVAETAQLPEALVAAATSGAEVVVVRQGLIGEATRPLLRELCRCGPAVLVLAEPGEDAAVDLVEVLQAGVRGYLPRRSAAPRLVEAVRALARHEAALDPAATGQLVRYLTSPAPQAPPGRGASCPLDRLTGRQREVAVLVAQGLSNEEIAGRLFVSLATVKSHLTASMRRVQVRTRTQLAILVARERSPVA
ncbi:response regulator transcription factor [Blastococcus sp. SYSU D00695]